MKSPVHTKLLAMHSYNLHHHTRQLSEYNYCSDKSHNRKTGRKKAMLQMITISNSHNRDGDSRKLSKCRNLQLTQSLEYTNVGYCV